MEEKQNEDTKKGSGILSLVALIGLVVLLVYAAPMLQDKLQKKGEEPEQSGVQGPIVDSDLEQWLPQVNEQLAQHGDESSRYHLLHMRLSEDGRKLLLEVKKGQDGDGQDLILTRDEFGRYISEPEDLPMKLYPPAKH